MPIRPIRETTTLDTPPTSSQTSGGTELREVTRLAEPDPKKPKAPPTAKADSE
jgi:hypothetical protein